MWSNILMELRRRAEQLKKNDPAAAPPPQGPHRYEQLVIALVAIALLAMVLVFALD